MTKKGPPAPAQVDYTDLLDRYWLGEARRYATRLAEALRKLQREDLAGRAEQLVEDLKRPAKKIARRHDVTVPGRGTQILGTKRPPA